MLSVPAIFEHKLCSLEDNKDLKVMSVSELVNSLHNTEMRHNLRSRSGAETALVADLRNRAKLGGGQTRKPVNRFSTEAKSSRLDSDSA